MEKNKTKIICENGNKKLLRILPEEDCEFMAEGATEKEIKESFPDFELSGTDFFLYKYFIMENGVIHTKGPDGVDITKELYGEDVFDEK